MSIIDHNSSLRDERLHEQGVHQHHAKDHGDIRRLEAENARLRERVEEVERQLAVAQRLLNYTPGQLETLVDPEKLAYVEWNMSSTYTLQLMCEAYREGKMEVRGYKAQAERVSDFIEDYYKDGVCLNCGTNTTQPHDNCWVGFLEAALNATPEDSKKE